MRKLLVFFLLRFCSPKFEGKFRRIDSIEFLTDRSAMKLYQRIDVVERRVKVSDRVD